MSRVITLEVSEDEFEMICQAHHNFQNMVEMNRPLEYFIKECAMHNVKVILKPYTESVIPELN